MDKVGILGGTFDPIHNGHMHLAKEAAEKLGLDRVILVPCGIPAHKTLSPHLSGQHRLKMCQLACEEAPWLHVDDIEVRKNGRQYTVDTLAELASRIPGQQLFLLLGTDTFMTIDRWAGFHEIVQLTSLVAIPREQDDKPFLEAAKNRLEQCGAHCIVLDSPALKVSSTLIRLQCAGGHVQQAQLPRSVAQYIAQHQLYRKP